MTRGREAVLVAAGAAVLAVALTWPLAFKIGHVGRVENLDGQLSIWNVAWVARTLVLDPRHVYDTNIFYPHRGTLAYSENNLGAGALAVPVYWATRNPYAAHNSVVLLAFALSAIGMYWLVRHLTGHPGAAAVAAISFAFCPFVFARLPHIQLLMTAGLPFAMLAFHRMADRPTLARGAVLGLAMTAAALCCGYYGIFVLLMVGFAVLVVAATRRMWTSRAYWIALGAGALVAIAIVLPLFVPYLTLHRTAGFERTLDQARRYSADWRAYLASSSSAHAWMLSVIGHWNDVTFPGLVATAFAVVGIATARGARAREAVLLYGGLAVLGAWASFGPAAGLYTVLYRAIPLFVWLRAPGRLGIVVVFALAVLAGYGVAWLLGRVRRPALVAAALAAVAVAELRVPLDFREVEPVAPAYRVLARQPRGPVIEMPFFYLPGIFFRHSEYMLNSTAHWMPLVNGYSDYIPPDFVEHVLTLAPFPSRDAFKLLEPNRVRYAVFHMNYYNTENRHDVTTRLKEFEAYLRPLYLDDRMRLYEIVGYPP